MNKRWPHLLNIMTLILSAINWAQFSDYLPYIVGIGVALLILGIITLRPKKRSPDHKLLNVVKKARASDPDMEIDSHGNRRSSVRRDGKLVRIDVASPSFRNKVESGYVLDRSTGGLRIAMSFPMTPGSAVQIRAANAPENIPWTTIIIRSSRDAGEHHEFGCEFEETPPWNVLLLFG